MSGFGSSSVLGKELGPVTLGQILSMIIALAIGLLLYTYGGANSPLVILIVAVVIYMLPHVFGADLKVKAGFGIVFAVIAIVVGAFVVGPAFIEENSNEHLSERNGITADITYSGTDATLDITYSGTEDHLVLVVSEVEGVVYNVAVLKNSKEINIGSGPNINHILTLDSSKLYNICIVPADTEGNLLSSKASYATLSGGGFIGDDTDCTLLSTCIIVGYTMILFFLVLALSTLMRRKLSDTRAKMEADGRLYPQGYGRCNFCGAVVLPGEVNCRKCGAYIDRPDYMKPHKKNYLTCSVCGAEISENMTECPKCGAKFEGEENIVVHADGSSDSSEDIMSCPGCGKKIPAVSEMCPYCGKKFE